MTTFCVIALLAISIGAVSTTPDQSQATSFNRPGLMNRRIEGFRNFMDRGKKHENWRSEPQKSL